MWECRVRECSVMQQMHHEFHASGMHTPPIQFFDGLDPGLHQCRPLGVGTELVDKRLHVLALPLHLHYQGVVAYG